MVGVEGVGLALYELIRTEVGFPGSNIVLFKFLTLSAGKVAVLLNHFEVQQFISENSSKMSVISGLKPITIFVRVLSVIL